jgi:tRNA pseudouridine38-40 synthase
MFFYRGVLEYVGHEFHGWQLQPRVKTVQGALLDVIECIAQERITCIYGSGRTDAGVHAHGQAFSFCLEKEIVPNKFIYSVNSILKNKLSILSLEIVNEFFDPRKNVTWKLYRYNISTRWQYPIFLHPYVWHRPKIGNVGIMKQQIRDIIGTHDFSSFRSSDCSNNNPVKTLHDAWMDINDETISIFFCGSGFLKNMVRILVGTLLEISQQRLPLTLKEILETKDRNKAGQTAPPQGLSLISVCYNNGWQSRPDLIPSKLN